VLEVGIVAEGMLRSQRLVVSNRCKNRRRSKADNVRKSIVVVKL